MRIWLIRIGQSALTVGVTWLIVDAVGFELTELRRVDSEIGTVRILGLLTASIMLLAAYFGSATIWGLIVHDLGGPKIPIRRAISMFMIANLGRYVPGKVWQIGGLATLAKGRGVPVSTAMGAAVIGQGVALLAAATWGLGAFLSGPDSYQFWGKTALVFVSGAILLISLPGVLPFLAQHWFRATDTRPHRSLGTLYGARWLALYLLNWSVYGLSFWMLAQSFGLTGGLLPFMSAFGASYVLGYAMVFAPAGIGPREGFLILFLTPHIGAPASAILAVATRIWTTIVEVIPAGLFWFVYVSGETDSEASGVGGQS